MHMSRLYNLLGFESNRDLHKNKRIFIKNENENCCIELFANKCFFYNKNSSLYFSLKEIQFPLTEMRMSIC